MASDRRSSHFDAPARTVSETPAFRVRLGTARPGESPGRVGKIKRLSGRIKAMVKTQGGAGSSSRRLGRFGRGGHAAAQFPASAYRQRVTVKARVVRHKGTRSGGGSASGALRKHVAYLERDGAGELSERGVAFNREGDVSREEVNALTERMTQDRHHFRFIVSPEAGDALDLKPYAQQLVGAMEQDLGTRLEWIGVAHYNTDNPHVHLLVRGRDEAGGDLVINREYLSHGLRLQAMELATRTLGPRLDVDIERAQRRDLKADRLTALDQTLAREAAAHAEGWVSALRAQNGSLASERQRGLKLARLQHLEGLGLARELRAGVWQLESDLVPRLRELGSRGDIVKLIHQRLRGSEPAIATVIFSKERPPDAPVTGRVFDRGLADELHDRRYVLVEARDGKAYYVPLSEYSERPGFEASVGSIVTVSPVAKTEARAADRNLLRHAASHEGVYDPTMHRELVERTVRLPPGVSADDYVHSHVKRAQALASRGLIESLGEGRYRIPFDLLERVAKQPAVGRDRGTVLQVERLSALDLQAQVTAEGATWLDRELAAGADFQGTARVGATRFERQLADALKRRARQLEVWGFADGEGTTRRWRTGFLEELYERELQAAQGRLRARYGELERLTAGQRLTGQLAAVEQLPSGPHAVLAQKGRFALLPAHGNLLSRVGQSVELTVSRGKNVSPTRPTTPQLLLRYRVLDLHRGRGLGR